MHALLLTSPTLVSFASNPFVFTEFQHPSHSLARSVCRFLLIISHSKPCRQVGLPNCGFRQHAHSPSPTRIPDLKAFKSGIVISRNLYSWQKPLGARRCAARARVYSTLSSDLTLHSTPLARAGGRAGAMHRRRHCCYHAAKRCCCCCRGRSRRRRRRRRARGGGCPRRPWRRPGRPARPPCPARAAWPPCARTAPLCCRARRPARHPARVSVSELENPKSLMQWNGSGRRRDCSICLAG